MGKDIKAKSIGEAIGTLIAKLCYRAADDIGDSLSDKTSEWRQNNALSILQKAETKYKEITVDGSENIHPRLMHHIIDEGSWNDDDTVQEMWSGLLASSCTKSGNDESNLLFINILKQLTSLEVKILSYSCEKCIKDVTEAGWIVSESLPIELNELVELTGISDFHHLDREMDHLRSIELIHHGFNESSTCADISPTALGLQLYVRSQGYIGSPVEYFNLQP